MNRADTQEECAFILDTLEGKLSLRAFNGEWQCFARYCLMQAGTATRSGFADLADVMNAAANRAARLGKR